MSEEKEKKKKICPICKKKYVGYPAISRKNNFTPICPDCGVQEAFEDYFNFKNIERKTKI